MLWDLGVPQQGNYTGYMSVLMSREAGPLNWFEKYFAGEESISVFDIQT